MGPFYRPKPWCDTRRPVRPGARPLLWQAEPMCGRYAASRSADDLVTEFEVERIDAQGAGAVPAGGLPADYNVAPTKMVHAVLQRPPHRGEAPVRRLVALRWGLIPSWAKDPAIGSRMINARMETAAEKPAYRRAFAARRCLLPADGYYEWYPTSMRGKGGKPRKQPFFIRPTDGGVLAMAGLYEIWRDQRKDRDDPEAWRWSCAVLTTTAEDAVGHVHDRMPLLVEPARRQAWLEPADSDADRLLSLLVPAAPGRLEALPVSTRVNDVRHNGPDLVAPLPMAEPPVAELPVAELPGQQMLDEPAAFDPV